MCCTTHWLKCLHERVSPHSHGHPRCAVIRSLTLCSSPCSFPCVSPIPSSSTWTLSWTSSSMWSSSGQYTSGTPPNEESGPLSENTPLTMCSKKNGVTTPVSFWAPRHAHSPVHSGSMDTSQELSSCRFGKFRVQLPEVRLHTTGVVEGAAGSSLPWARRSVGRTESHVGNSNDETFTKDVCDDTLGWHCFVDDGCINDTQCFQSGFQKAVQQKTLVKWCVVQMWSSLSDSSYWRR